MSATASAVSLLEQLVAFDSVSSHSNLPIIHFIEDYLKKHGVQATPLPSPDGKKSNLLARIGPDVAGGIVLSGHTDVVPIDGQPWDSNPFRMIEKDGRLYGRGTCDMKGFLAICLAMVPHWVKMNLTRPLWLAFSYDEEIGCLGAPHLLAHIVKHIPMPAYAIIGEPTEMRVVTAHKGVLSFETTVHGLEAHSSQPHLGVNAVHIACELVHYLTAMGREHALSGKQDARFEPPYSTVHVGIINGGTARNIIPRECKICWEIRPLPGDDCDHLIERFHKHCRELIKPIKAKHPQADITSKPMSRMAGVSLPEGARHSCQTVMRCAKSNEEHVVSFGTEAGVFNEYGVPAIICGPGSIDQAHQPNEYIEMGQMQKGMEFMQRLTDEITKDK